MGVKIRDEEGCEKARGRGSVGGMADGGAEKKIQ
jgi:hypothetical protein